MSTNRRGRAAIETPFDRVRLDRLMEEAGIDLVLVTTKHSAQYLLGGYKFFFFAEMDAIERCVNYFNPERYLYRLQLQRHRTAGPD